VADQSGLDETRQLAITQQHPPGQPGRVPHRGPPGLACRGDTGALLVERYFST
jgi:hypothetical protein